MYAFYARANLSITFMHTLRQHTSRLPTEELESTFSIWQTQI